MIINNVSYLNSANKTQKPAFGDDATKMQKQRERQINKFMKENDLVVTCQQVPGFNNILASLELKGHEKSIDDGKGNSTYTKVKLENRKTFQDCASVTGKTQEEAVANLYREWPEKAKLTTIVTKTRNFDLQS